MTTVQTETFAASTVDHGVVIAQRTLAWLVASRPEHTQLPQVARMHAAAMRRSDECAMGGCSGLQ